MGEYDQLDDYKLIYSYVGKIKQIPNYMDLDIDDILRELSMLDNSANRNMIRKALGEIEG